jgi:hypothetical protein
LQLEAGLDHRVTTIGFDTNGFVDAMVDPADRTVLLDNDKVGRTSTQTLPDTRQISFATTSTGTLPHLHRRPRPVHKFEFTPVDRVSKYTPPSLPGNCITGYEVRAQQRPTDRVDHAPGRLGY